MKPGDRVFVRWGRVHAFYGTLVRYAAQSSVYIEAYWLIKRDSPCSCDGRVRCHTDSRRTHSRAFRSEIRVLSAVDQLAGLAIGDEA